MPSQVRTSRDSLLTRLVCVWLKNKEAMSHLKALEEETQPGHVPPSLADQMHKLAEKHQKEDHKSFYRQVTKQIEAYAKQGQWEMRWPTHLEAGVKELLIADGFKLEEGYNPGESGSCTCDFGCSSCPRYHPSYWTTIKWGKPAQATKTKS